MGYEYLLLAFVFVVALGFGQRDIDPQFSWRGYFRTVGTIAILFAIVITGLLIARG